ncbi:MAG: ATP-binding protein [Clostridiales bacterium]|nr:ATP-binding protein [Clostridiales bacterium]
MKRKIMNRLVEWKKKKDRMPLIINGARQVGKTYIVNEFGRENYENIIYINFETNEDIVKDFEVKITPGFLIGRMELFFGEKIEKGKTLIFFDEIQVCERALTSLKYFCEEAPEYHVVAAGRLLGLAIDREKASFPVGKVDMMTLYPMDFEEFLWSLERDSLASEIRKCHGENEEVSPSIHSLCLELVRTYLIVGGMPNVIKKYAENKRIIDAANIKNGILDSYIADMFKYTSRSEATKVIGAYDSIPSQLAKENKKFQYKIVKKGGTATIFGASLVWLESAGVILKCHKIEHGYMPPRAYRDLSSFKIYMSDIGLLTLKAKISLHSIMSSEINNFTFIGALVENYVAQALKTNGFDLHYWTSKDSAEIDFIIQNEDLIIPIEVKAGTNTRSRSLNVYKKKYNPEYSIRISAKNFGFENEIKSVPLYAVFCIEK